MNGVGLPQQWQEGWKIKRGGGGSKIAVTINRSKKKPRKKEDETSFASVMIGVGLRLLISQSYAPIKNVGTRGGGEGRERR